MKLTAHGIVTFAWLLSVLGSGSCYAAQTSQLASSNALPWVLAASIGLWALALLSGQRRMRQAHASFEDKLRCERHLREVAERALDNATSVLSKSVAQQEGIKEDERRRIARDIHDDLGQNLLALKIEVSLLHVSTTGIHPQINQKLAAIAANLDRTIKSLRTIINDLRPLALEAGLQTAVEWQLDEFSRISGIHHQLDAHASAYVAGEHKELDAILFRILQESLSNITRHAHATEVSVKLACSANRLSMRVVDNGIGMPIHEPTRGCGLRSIRDRVAALGGQFVIDSQPGAGTSLVLSIPVAQPLDAAASS